jgi:imidazolonepropionase-like amidohydrolase
MTKPIVWPCLAAAVLLGAGDVEIAGPQQPPRVFTGASVIDGAGGPPIPNATIVVRDGRIESVGTSAAPAGAERVDVSGRWIVPGFVNTHGHVGETRGLQSGAEYYTEENVRAQLGLYARYGVTTIASLGGDREAGFRLRDERDPRGRARLLVAGPVIAADTVAAARAAVDEAARLGPDFIKIRVDDNLGTSKKMTPDVYTAVIEQAHRHGLRVAAHLFYLEDAKGLLRAGVDFLAHSVRDRDVDRELIDLMKARNVCLCPTLMREVSTFVYESRPSFFDDPAFLREADRALLAELEKPARQATVRASPSAQGYKAALEVARRNVKALHDAGVRLAFGTDTGPPARFQGYFEHLELEELVKAGLTPADALLSATRDAAACLGLDRQLGTLAPGRAADFLVLTANPLEDVRGTRAIESVWIGGARVPGRGAQGSQAP